MAMAIGLSGLRDNRTEREEARGQRKGRIGSALRALLNRKDDRLLRDAGLTRDDVLGTEGAFWQEWSREKTPWTL
jgi:hypothetical protein